MMVALGCPVVEAYSHVVRFGADAQGDSSSVDIGVHHAIMNRDPEGVCARAASRCLLSR